MRCFFQAEDGIRDAQESRGLGDVYKRQGRDGALAHQADEPAHGLAGVDRVEEDSLGAGHEADGLALGAGDDGRSLIHI